MEYDRPREVKFHQSANRHNMILGGDRELVLLAALFAAIFIFAVGKLWAIFFGIVLWLFAVAVLSRMGKADPMMRQVYIQHVRYASFYPAKSGVQRISIGTKAKW